MASEALKKQLKVSSEKMVEAALDEAVALAKVYAADSESVIDDQVVSAIELLKKSFLDDLVDKIDGEEG